MGKQHKLYLVNKGELFEPFSATEKNLFEIFFLNYLGYIAIYNGCHGNH
jgi:hypothetical protein